MSKPKHHTPWASKDGIVKSIVEVSNGKACGCTCLVCGSALIAAKNGKIRQPHFRHKSVAECTTSPETFLHYAAKEILERNKRMMLPPCRMLVTSKSISFSDGKANYTAKNARENINIEFDSIVSEKKFSDYIPDLIAHFCGKILVIEIVVTHDIDDDKMRKIEASEADAAIRIYLGDLDRATTAQELEQIILTPSWRTTWVMNKKAVAEAARVKQPQVIEFANKQKRLAEERQMKYQADYQEDDMPNPSPSYERTVSPPKVDDKITDADIIDHIAQYSPKIASDMQYLNNLQINRLFWCYRYQIKPAPIWCLDEYIVGIDISEWRVAY